MGKITKIILKNIKYLLRAKASSLIVIYGPLLLIFLLGISYDNANFQNVKVAVYSDSYSEISDSFIEKLSETQFHTSKVSTDDICVEGVKRGTMHICIIFPANMTIDSQAAIKNEIEIYVDYSKLNIVYMVMETISSKIQAQEEEISFDLTALILDKLRETQTELNLNKNKISDISTGMQNLEKKVQSIDSELNNMDTTIDVKVFGVNELTNKREQLNTKLADYSESSGDEIDRLKNNINDIAVDIRDELDGIDDFMEDIRDEIDDSENDTLYDFDEIEDGIDKIEDNADKIRGILKDGENITDRTPDTIANEYSAIMDYMEELDIAIEDLNSSLQELVIKFDGLTSTKNLLSNELGTVSTGMKEQITKLNGFQTTITNINNNINSITVTEAANIANPITTTIKPVAMEEKTHLNYVFPSMIVLIIMFVTILLSSTIVSMEKTSRAYFRNFITPAKDYMYVIANYLTNLFLILVQLVLIVAIAAIFFKTQVISSLFATIIILLLISSFFILLGMLIGYLFNSDETTTLASVIVASILLVLSGLIIPLEGMSASIMRFMHYNPFVISEFMLKQAMLFNMPLIALWKQLITIFILCVVMMIAIWMILMFNKRHVLHKYALKVIHSKSKKKKYKDKPHYGHHDLHADLTEAPSQPGTKHEGIGTVSSVAAETHLIQSMEDDIEGKGKKERPREEDDIDFQNEISKLKEELHRLKKDS